MSAEILIPKLQGSLRLVEHWDNIHTEPDPEEKTERVARSYLFVSEDVNSLVKVTFKIIGILGTTSVANNKIKFRLIIKLSEKLEIPEKTKKNYLDNLKFKGSREKIPNGRMFTAESPKDKESMLDALTATLKFPEEELPRVRELAKAKIWTMHLDEKQRVAKIENAYISVKLGGLQKFHI